MYIAIVYDHFAMNIKCYTIEPGSCCVTKVFKGTKSLCLFGFCYVTCTHSHSVLAFMAERLLR